MGCECCALPAGRVLVAVVCEEIIFITKYCYQQKISGLSIAYHKRENRISVEIMTQYSVILDLS